MSYSVNLEVYEGPLDLLLKLIDQNQVDIYDIPIAKITDQYLEQLSIMVEVDLDVMADFLVMAATLIRIKTKMLVPRHGADYDLEDEDEIDPREELVKKLVEYRKFKMLAGDLQQKYEGSTPRVYFRDDAELVPEVEIRASLNQLLNAFKTVWEQKEDDTEYYEIPQGDIDIGEKMEEILERLAAAKRGLVLQDLFLGAVSRREALALFMALLELMRQNLVRASQMEMLGPIKIVRVRGI